MKYFDILPSEKRELTDSITDFINKKGDYEQYPVIMKCGCLADHELYYIGKKLSLTDGEGRKTKHDYFMFLEKAREGFLGIAEQYFDFFAFNETEIKSIIKKQEIFNEDEIRYMECEYDDYEEEEY